MSLISGLPIRARRHVDDVLCLSIPNEHVWPVMVDYRRLRRLGVDANDAREVVWSLLLAGTHTTLPFYSRTGIKAVAS